MVVHREAEQDHEEEHRQPGCDAAVPLEVEQVRAPAPLEDGHQQAVGRGHRQQVHQDRLDRDHDRAERDEQQHEREAEHEDEDERRRRLHLLRPVLRGCRVAGDRVLDAGDRADRGREDLAAKRVERVVRRRVRAAPTRGIATRSTLPFGDVSV